MNDLVQSDTLAKAQSLELDIENIFLLYATFCGDVERTAHACNRTPSEIISLASVHGWNEKLRGIIELKRSGKPGDVERAINRALNFVQAHKFRLFLERVLRDIYALDSAYLMELLVVGSVDKDGNKSHKLSTRAFADLAAALEKCQAMTYLALGDSAGERKGREEAADSEASGVSLHSKLAALMANNSPSAALADSQK